MVSFSLTPLDLIGAAVIAVCMVLYFGSYLRRKPLRDHIDELVCCVMFVWATVNIFLLLNLYRFNQGITLQWADLFSYLVYWPYFILLGLVFACTLIIRA